MHETHNSYSKLKNEMVNLIHEWSILKFQIYFQMLGSYTNFNICRNTRNGVVLISVYYSFTFKYGLSISILGTYFILTHSAKLQRKWLSLCLITCFHERYWLCPICQEKGNTARDSWILSWYIRYIFCVVNQTSFNLHK
jgi:hypothetical protein